MVTFDKLVQDAKLVRVVVPLGRGQFHDRWIYAYPNCVQWMRAVVPTLVTGRMQSQLSPKEQLYDVLRKWIAGDKMAYGRMFSDLEPRIRHVWEMKTHDLRIFGWMYQPKKFIAVFGDYADDYKEPTKTKTYGAARDRVVRARDVLPLDGIKYVQGDFDDLV